VIQIASPSLRGELSATLVEASRAARVQQLSTEPKFSRSIVPFRLERSDLRLYAARIRAPFGLGFDLPAPQTWLVSMAQRGELGAHTTGYALAIVRAGENWRFPAC
jgi:hypothetical protein